MMKETNIIRTMIYESPCGTLRLGELDGRLCLCNWTHGKHCGREEDRLCKLLHARFEEARTETLGIAAEQLDEYFAGQRKEFDIPLLFAGTDFQKKVWNELLNIPCGSTVSYGEMARRIGMPAAVRAVANANGANAISIFAPCHRVIGSDRSLTGYGGGLSAKKALLELEGFRFQAGDDVHD